ncbi:MAG TPA: class I SAM-dependent methyltransferase [Methanoregula sp.]|nr:class I SAM-dependent methyltransferase [Methanoregula sp.]
MDHTTVPDDGTWDWNKVWKERQRRHELSKASDDPSHNWDKKENAERYDATSRSEYDPRIRLTLAGLEVSHNSRVLDIGAGTGTLAIPLAPLVKEVTAVEPGAGMVSILEERAAKEGITNISCVPKRWEDVDIKRDLSGPYDTVVASLSLTMEDIRAALKKMDAVSREYVNLYWFVDMPFWERMYAELWEPLHGTAYYSGPKADCLFNVLYQMGIYANVEMLPLSKEYRFGNQDEMLAFFRRRFGAKSQEQIGIVDAYVRPMIREQGNEFVISGDSTFARIWWKKK